MLRMFLKFLARGLFKLLYRVEVRGLENYKKAGSRTLILANHTSFLDAPLLAVFLPGNPSFVIDAQTAQTWWVKPFLSLCKTLPVDPTNPIAIKSVIRELQQDRPCVVFPEGRITTTGGLMKIYEGSGMMAKKADAQILPIRIDGAQHTPFAYTDNITSLFRFPKITLSILEPVEDLDKVPGHSEGARLYAIMSNLIFKTSERNNTLFAALIKARSRYGGKYVVAEDVNRQPATYNQIIMRSFILGRKIAQSTSKGEHVGLLLPNMVVTAIAFFALQSHGRVPTFLNVTAGAHNILLNCKTASLKVIYTSKKFEEAAQFEDLSQALRNAGIEVLYLEDVAASLSVGNKLYGLFGRVCPNLFYRKHRPDPEDAAVVLFTSGSEKAPKGVVLSHTNILANCAQVLARVDFSRKDIAFNALPLFHSFGLTCGTILPMLMGMKTFLYPSPLHYRVIPEMVYFTGATILFGTDTFLSHYADTAHPYDFRSVRYIFAGAEKLRTQTWTRYAEKFGVRILQGYGVTETAPIITVNTAMNHKLGTVGQILPGIEYKLEKMEGVDEGGVLHVKGPNIMKGYLLEESQGKIIPPPQGWHDTGDVVSVDEEGFFTIKGRAKRFAKISGEMISLAAVEAYLQELWPGYKHAVVAVADPTKGERLVLVTDNPTAQREAIIPYVKEHHLRELSIPRTVHIVEDVPLLPSGKTDYVSVKKLAES